MIKASKVVVPMGEVGYRTVENEPVLCGKYLRMMFEVEFMEDLPKQIKVTISDYCVDESSVLFHWLHKSRVVFEELRWSHKFSQGINEHPTFWDFWEWCEKSNLTESFYITVADNED